MSEHRTVELRIRLDRGAGRGAEAAMRDLRRLHKGRIRFRPPSKARGGLWFRYGTLRVQLEE